MTPTRKPSASSSRRDLRIAKGARGRKPFASIAEAVDAIRQGRLVIVVDDEDRENEGDLTIAAEKVTPDIVNFMVTHGRGLVCLALTPERLERLDIPSQVAVNSSLRETALCVPIGPRGAGTTPWAVRRNAWSARAVRSPSTCEPSAERLCSA